MLAVTREERLDRNAGGRANMIDGLDDSCPMVDRAAATPATLRKDNSVRSDDQDHPPGGSFGFKTPRIKPNAPSPF